MSNLVGDANVLESGIAIGLGLAALWRWYLQRRRQRALHDTVQQQIQRNEARLLGRLPAREQQRFLDAVRVLADRPERDLDTSAS